jgi:hypothetical protein
MTPSAFLDEWWHSQTDKQADAQTFINTLCEPVPEAKQGFDAPAPNQALTLGVREPCRTLGTARRSKRCRV